MGIKRVKREREELTQAPSEYTLTIMSVGSNILVQLLVFKMMLVGKLSAHLDALGCAVWVFLVLPVLVDGLGWFL